MHTHTPIQSSICVHKHSELLLIEYSELQERQRRNKDAHAAADEPDRAADLLGA